MVNARQPLGYVIILIGTILWCALLVVPPYLAASDQLSLTASHYAYQFFSTICHQYDSRSLHVAGYKLAVCARCTGIYFGFLFGVLLVPLFLHRVIRRTLHLLSFAALPMLVDVALGVVHIHEPTLVTRLITGLCFGVCAAIVLVPLLENVLSQIVSQQLHTKGVRYESETR